MDPIYIAYYVPNKGVCFTSGSLDTSTPGQSTFNFFSEVPFVILKIFLYDEIHPVNKIEKLPPLQRSVAKDDLNNAIQYLPYCQVQDFNQSGSYTFTTDV